MPEFIVRETLTTLRRVEADNETAAIEIAKNRGCSDFDEVDPQIEPTFSAKLDPDADPASAPPDTPADGREEPIWTGRYGQPRLDVIENGKDFHVFNIINAQDPADNGVVIFGPEALPINPRLVDGWVDNIVIRAYNAEDAMRNAAGALAQWNAWFNRIDGDWETLPFTDAEGNFPEDGGDHGEGYDAFPPDDAAVGGVTRPDLFPDDAYGFRVPATVVLERESSRVSAPRM